MGSKFNCAVLTSEILKNAEASVFILIVPGLESAVLVITLHEHPKIHKYYFMGTVTKLMVTTALKLRAPET